MIRLVCGSGGGGGVCGVWEGMCAEEEGSRKGEAI